MKRVAMDFLREWKTAPDRKPLLVRGARQVGKSYLVREFGRSFKYFAEANLELNPHLIKIFEETFEPEDIIFKLSITLNTEIIPGESLLFIDEIQYAPHAILALRYFYEKLPQLHVIAAGSLIDFSLEKFGLPVGRVRSLYLFPLSFIEFLWAKGSQKLADYLLKHNPAQPMDTALHQNYLSNLSEYFAIGGMPEAVLQWIEKKDLKIVRRIHNDLLDTYRQDFEKYARRQKIQYIEKIFEAVPRLLGQKFRYVSVAPEIRSRNLKQALDLLSKAGIVHMITHSSANGQPLGAEANQNIFKTIFLDIGLAQTILGAETGQWIVDMEKLFVNKGEIAEAFVGQEILAYSDPFIKKRLYYWVRERKNASAEVDYVDIINNKVTPIEVKSGMGHSLKSLLIFLKEKHPPGFGIHFSLNNFYQKDRIQGLPLYAVCKLFQDQ